MTRTTKAAVLIIIFALCALGAIFSPGEVALDHKSKTQVVPVNNRQPQRGVWLRV
jgi:hypothetical protein